MMLDKFLSNLSVHVEPFAICTMSEGWRLCLPGPSGLLVHFVLDGTGTLYGPRADIHPIAPLHLSVVPAGAKHVLESSGNIRNELRIDAPPAGDQVCHIVAGSSDHPSLVVGCGIICVRYGPSLDLFDHLQKVLSVDLSGAPGALAAFEGILVEQSNALAGSEAMTAAFMTQCLVHLFRGIHCQGEDAALPWLIALQDQRLGRVIDVILNDPGADYTVESLADVAGMSRSAFAAHFSRLFGRSPISFANHVRMQRAAQMLAVEGSSIDQITRSIGFSSRSHFSQAFKAHTGLSPNAFRAKYAAA